jgi:hypothetical protein
VGYVDEVVVVIDCKMASLTDLTKVFDRGKAVDSPEGTYISDPLALTERTPAATIIYPILYLSLGKHDLMVHCDPLYYIDLLD